MVMMNNEYGQDYL